MDQFEVEEGLVSWRSQENSMTKKWGKFILISVGISFGILFFMILSVLVQVIEFLGIF